MQSVLEAAVDAYLRQQFVRELNAGYADWRMDDVSWHAHQSDLSEWEDYTGLDGLPNSEDERAKAAETAASP
jgi:hypothetical protein